MSNEKPAAPKRFVRLGLILLLGVFAILGVLIANNLDAEWVKFKIHVHVPTFSASGQKQQLISLNEDSVDLLEAAEKHDQRGEVELASDDYRECVSSPSFFQTISGRPRSAIQELVDTRHFATAPDYFDELVCHSRVTFWPESRMPIKVYVPDEKVGNGFSQLDREAIKNSLDEWCALVPGRLSYKFIDDADKADIVFSQTQKSADLGLSQAVMAHTVPICEGPPKWRVGIISKVKIDVVRSEPPITDASDSRMTRRNAVFLHEIGHALGLDGHSCNGNDMMFFQNVVFKMTDRDRNTFKKIYAEGTPFERAERSLKAMAQKDDKYALIALAGCLREAGTAAAEQQKVVFELAKRSADLGLARAQLWVGFMYANGDGVKRDLHKAAQYYELAAKQDVGPAFLELANLYQIGEGVEQDVPRAQAYLRKAVRMDSVAAELSYADLLCYQYGTAESYGHAVKFYTLAAGKNSGEAMARLSKLYSQGYGVQKDLKLSDTWMRRALSVIEKQKPKDAEDYYSRGLLYHEIHRSKEAIADYSRALQLRPKFRNGYLTRAMEYDEIGEHTKALEDYNAALKIDPDCVKGYYARSLTNLCLNRPKEAIADVNEVMARTYDPDFHRMYVMLYAGFAEKMLGDEAAAKKYFAEAAKRSVKQYWPAPIVAYLNGQLSAEQLLSQSPGDQRGTEARAFMGVNQALSGDSKGAVKNLEWVKKFGDGHFYEYPIAISTLERIEKLNTIAKK